MVDSGYSHIYVTLEYQIFDHILQIFPVLLHCADYFIFLASPGHSPAPFFLVN